MSWTTRAEAEICTLREVEGVSIHASGDDVREIHVLTSSKRPAKQIVRDIQSLLATRFNRQIDHRVVSVAYVDPPAAPASPGASAASSDPRAPIASENPGHASGVRTPAQSAARSRNGEASLAEERDDEPETDALDRIRFVSVNTFVSGPRVQAQVELKWQGVSRMGSASGWSTRDGAHRLVAGAAVAAILEFFPKDLALSLEGLDFIRVGRQPIVVVALELLAHREHKMLVGCCSVGKDRQQAIVLAALAALNRVLGSLPLRETSEVR